MFSSGFSNYGIVWYGVVRNSMEQYHEYGQRWARYFFKVPAVPVLCQKYRHLKIKSITELFKKSCKKEALHYILLIFS